MARKQGRAAKRKAKRGAKRRTRQPIAKVLRKMAPRGASKKPLKRERGKAPVQRTVLAGVNVSTVTAAPAGALTQPEARNVVPPAEPPSIIGTGGGGTGTGSG